MNTPNWGGINQEGTLIHIRLKLAVYLDNHEDGKMKIDSRKYRAVIIGLILFLTAIAYAGTCEFRCVYCVLVEFAGCNQPAPNNGYCSKSPNGQHAFMLVKEH